MRNAKSSAKRVLPKPDKVLLAKLTELTADNNHGKVYELIAKWCKHYVPFDDDNAYECFNMFESMFKAMNRAHEEIGNFPYGDLRYEVGKRMEARMLQCFGTKVVELFNVACR